MSGTPSENELSETAGNGWGSIPDPEPECLSDDGLSIPTREADLTMSVIQTLKEAHIPCCLVGVSALIFYGATRVRSKWEICVPTELVDRAYEILLSPPNDTKYRLLKPWPYPSPSTLHFTYSRFKSKGISHCFVIIPSRDAHIDCSNPSNLTSSLRGLPYPKLEVFVQACLDKTDRLELEDVVDGTDVSEQWGEDHLDLDGTNDVEWSQEMHQKGLDFAKTCNDPRVESWAPNIHAVTSRRELWQKAVRNKERRIGWDLPKDLYLTQYRFRGQIDPWLELSTHY